MITINYYLNGQILFTEKLLNILFFRKKKNSIIEYKGNKYILCSCNYDIFDNIIDIVLKLKYNFKYSIFIKNYEERLLELLDNIGYTKSDVCGSGKNLITNNLGYYYFTDLDYINGSMGYICNNTSQAIAIAAINDHTDKNQWFMFPDGEYELCEYDSFIEEYGEFENTDYPKKLTPEQIINLL